jgi:bacterioferritin
MAVRTHHKNDAPATHAETTRERIAAPVSAEQLIEELNHDLAGEYQAVLMYVQYSAKLTGPFRDSLRDLFQKEIADELRHAQFLADKIAVLDGDPTTGPRLVPQADDPRSMLENVLNAEKQTIADYKARVSQAELFGDIGLRVDLENIIADETRHKEEIERILTGWDRF